MEHPNHFPDLVNPGRFVDILPGEVPGKEAALEIHLTDHVRTGKPFLIFSAMIPQQTRIKAMCDRLGLRTTVMNHTTSMKQRNAADEMFRKGQLDGLICSTDIAGVGYNWQDIGGQELEHMIFMSLGYKDTAFFQGYRRAMRGVRKTRLRITILEYLNSIDQRVFQINERKAEDAHKVDPTRQILEL